MNGLDIEKIAKKYSRETEDTFTGYLMYKDEKIAFIKENIVEKILNKKLLPIIMLSGGSGAFEAWLQTRVIDTHRTNSRQVRRRLSLRSEVPNEIVIKARGVSITDCYWVKEEQEIVTYKDIREKLSDGLNKVALYGNSDELSFDENNITPELTNIGSFEKCWKLFDDGWYMIKKGSLKENFAEVLISKIGRVLGFNIVAYEPIDEGRLVKCKDFTDGAKVDFEPLYSFVKDYWEIDNSIEIIEELGFIKEFLDITFLDALCYNIDRHTFNFGFIRKDGEIITLAPNFDNNLGLSGVLNNKGLENTWYSTAFTRNNYLPTLKEHNYLMPNIDMTEIKALIEITLKEFPSINNESEFKNVVYKIIESNYNVLKENLK